jgi:hypothetical protein
LTTSKDIQQALSVLSSIGNGYSPDQRSFDFSGYGDKYKVNYADILKKHPVNYSFTPSTSSKKKKSSSGINLFDMLSGTLGQPSGFMTTMLSNVIDDAKNIKDKDTPLWKKIMELSPTGIMGKAAAQGIKGGAKEQWKDWTDGKISWGDAGAGFLHGMDKSWKRGSDIMEQAGVKNRWGKVGGGLGIDIALDPLTYLTGGLSAASKLGKAAEATKIAELSKATGITGKFKKADDFIEAATDSMKSSMTRKYPNVSESVIDKTVAKKVDELAQQIKTARNTTYNSHVNDWGFSVPFTNKFAKVGTYGKKNILHNSEALVPEHLVKELLGKAALGNDTAHLLEEAVRARYGVDNMGQISKTMFDDLHEMMQPIIKQLEDGKSLPDVKVAQEVGHSTFHADDFEKLMDKFVKDNVPWKDVQKQLDEIMTQTNVGKHAGNLRSSYGADLANMVKKYWETKPAKNFSGAANARKAESMKWAERLLRDSDTVKKVETKVTDIFPHGSPEANAAKDARVFNKQFGKMLDTTYNEMGNFKTNFEHWLDKKNIFNARTLATGDKFTNSMGDHIADAHSQRIGETARYSRSMDDIQKFVSKIPENEREQLMREAIYVLENHAPESLGGKNWVPSAQAKELANKIKPVIDRIGQQEQGGGVLDQLRNNYFPHVVNHEEGSMEKIQEFMKRNPALNGKSSKSSFNKERTGFQTIAERDNYITKLEKAIQKEANPNTALRYE